MIVQWVINAGINTCIHGYIRMMPNASNRRDSMIRGRLRIYCGPEENGAAVTVATAQEKQQTITVSAREIFTALADAVRHDRAWLRDFEDEDVTISSDLYEIILAYQHFRRPSA